MPVSGRPRWRATESEKAQRPQGTQSLFGIVQGGMDLDSQKGICGAYRRDWISRLRHRGPQRRRTARATREVIEATLRISPGDKPRYVMGVGTPEEIVEYARLGVDMMDCVLPTRAARHGLLFTSEGKVSIKQARYTSGCGAARSELRLPGMPALFSGLPAASLFLERSVSAGFEYLA